VDYGQGSRKIPWTNLVLFVITLFTTTLAGALQSGANPFEDPLSILKGIPFSATLLLILGVHEFGHYFASKRWGVKATLPYFIPFPTLIGTLGAVIKVKSRIPSRKALVDIGASGPICGFVMAIVVSWFGLSSSRPVPPSEVPAGIMLGESIAFKVISRFAVGELPEGYDLELSPVAFAGWLGLFITALNLLPMGQLDGGHVIYALFGRKHRFVALGALLVILPLGTRWLGWLIWGILMVFMGLMKHPPPMDPYTPLDGRRKFIALLAIAIFIVSFIPVPFSGF